MAAPTTVGLTPASSICTSRHTSNVLTGIFVRLLQEHFSDSQNLEFNGENEYADSAETRPAMQLQDYIWTPSNETTKIQIQPVWAYNPQDIQRRPALYVKRNAQRPQRMAINDGMTIAARRTGPLPTDIEVRGEYHSVMVLGSHTIFCAGGTGAEVELLAQEVFDQVAMFAPLLRTDFKFHRVAMQELGEIAILDAEGGNHYVIPVVIAYAYALAWRIKQIAPWLKSLSVEVHPSPDP